MDYLINVCITLLPHLKIIIYYLMYLTFAYLISKLYIKDRIGEHWGTVSKYFGIAYKWGTAIIVATVLVMSFTASSNIPKRELINNQQTIQGVVKQINNNENIGKEKVDIIRQPKHTESERAERFKELTDWKNQ